MLQYPTNPDSAFESFIIGNDTTLDTYFGRHGFSIDECHTQDMQKDLFDGPYCIPREFVYFEIDGSNRCPATQDVSQEMTQQIQFTSFNNALSSLYGTWQAVWLPNVGVAFVVVTSCEMIVQQQYDSANPKNSAFTALGWKLKLLPFIPNIPMI